MLTPSATAFPADTGRDDPDAIVAGDFNGDGKLDLAVANCDVQHRLDPAGQWRRDVPARRRLRRSGTTRPRSWPGDFNGDGQLDLAVANASSTAPSRSCWATVTGRSSPPSIYPVGTSPGRRSWRVISTATAISTWPSRTPDSDDVSDPVGQRRRDVPARRRRTPSGRDPDAIVAGDFNGDGRLDLAVADQATSSRVGRSDGVACCWATATGRSSPRSITRSGRTPMRSWRATSPATASRPGRRRLDRRRPSSSPAGQRRRDVPARRQLRGRGSSRRRSWRVTSPATASSTSPSPTVSLRTTPSRSLLGNGDGTFQPAGHLRGRERIRTPSWRATSPATGSSTWPSRTRTRARSRSCWVTAMAPSRPTVGERRGCESRRHRGGRLQRRRPSRPGRRELKPRTRLDPAGQRRRHVPARGRVRGGAQRPMRSWRATSTATAGSTWPSPTRLGDTVVGPAG